MKLIVSLTLIWMISNTEPLKCYHKQISSSDPPGPLGPSGPPFLRTCGSADGCCATIAFQQIFGGIEKPDVIKGCLPPFLCDLDNQVLSFSDSERTVAASVHCCKTDGCNIQDKPFPGHGKENGLKCPTCTRNPDGFWSCNNTLECVGVQDRCIAVNVGDDYITSVLGCVSAKTCEVLSMISDLMLYYDDITPRIAGAGFCNSAWMINPGIVPLLLGLFALFVF
ncbi:phospholipase A2 inhibitor and Ly6/PLAUR domain-containing protein-like isoform X2 [Anabas testudineus]|uniref:phospholipase A2 inhibitor and Ly6/PLAUR domain-containing protein-like isoform X2 n=1 Tax=Anabas testudineus TaxID=64144 RepID=UPI000E457694|nr:phospholipase A2 inhibitor and Ly6/PLAUR domain-containing protein-like isoform X2 [Anabas testudineus]